MGRHKAMTALAPQSQSRLPRRRWLRLPVTVDYPSRH